MIHSVKMQVTIMLLAGLSLDALTYGLDVFTHGMAVVVLQIGTE